jgi:hypothetical protein
MGANMKTIVIASFAAALSLVAVGGADARGCLKGAAVGAVGGHFAGHHALAGAAVGCAVGHHMAHREAMRANHGHRR